MKKILYCSLVLLFFVLIIISCSKKSDVASPVADSNPPAGTATATDTGVVNTFTQTATVTETGTTTETSTVTDTATNTPTYTMTNTFTNTATNTPNATQTVQAQMTFVAGLSHTSLTSVPNGTFTQQNTSGQSFQHTISSFKIGQYEVTYELWYYVRQWAINNGYTFANAGREGKSGTIGAVPAGKQPVTTINWRDMIVWCNAYSQMMQLTPVYYSDAGFTNPIKDSTDGAYGNSLNSTPGSFDNPYVNWNANGYRLLTEGEWQYAASYIDGTNWTPYNYAAGDSAPYDTSTTLGNYCWYSANSGSTTHNVGEKVPTALSLYDMSGNVWEMCWDWWAYYPSSAQNNYRGPDTGVVRIMKSAGYNLGNSYMQIGGRNSNDPYTENNTIGFRIGRSN